MSEGQEPRLRRHRKGVAPGPGVEGGGVWVEEVVEGSGGGVFRAGPGGTGAGTGGGGLGEVTEGTGVEGLLSRSDAEAQVRNLHDLGVAHRRFCVHYSSTSLYRLEDEVTVPPEWSGSGTRPER